MCDQSLSGYISGKKKATIPWAKLCEDPSSWIKPECVPDGFQWADPSKIRIGDVFRLLDHWRTRKQNHLEPLIWVSSCPLLEDVEHQSEHCGGQEQSSESSSDSDSDTDSTSDHETHSNSEDGFSPSSDNGTHPNSEKHSSSSSDHGPHPNSSSSSSEHGEPEGSFPGKIHICFY